MVDLIKIARVPRNEGQGQKSRLRLSPIFQSLLFALQQIVQFPDQLEESVVIVFFLDQCAQPVHSLSLIWCHA
jgi:hypothetical protein